jgi:hypothetical protein
MSDQPDDRRVPFRSIRQGQVFFHEEGKFMRLQGDIRHNYGGEKNAVCLEGAKLGAGTVTFFSSDTAVSRPSAEVIQFHRKAQA